ncbi:MAG TPA: hypothetical protein VN442_09240 [Bryobacteraceae bacterium]|nr:hypothetical protein [Bryobacteraceae bacterium]
MDRLFASAATLAAAFFPVFGVAASAFAARTAAHRLFKAAMIRWRPAALMRRLRSAAGDTAVPGPSSPQA